METTTNLPTGPQLGETPQPEGATTQVVSQPPQMDILSILASKNRKTSGKVVELIELQGNASLTADGKIPTDPKGTPIISFDGVRLENNNQLCRFAFKGKKLIDKINTKLQVKGNQILAKATFKLKRSDDETYFVSDLHDLDS